MVYITPNKDQSQSDKTIIKDRNTSSFHYPNVPAYDNAKHIFALSDQWS